MVFITIVSIVMLLLVLFIVRDHIVDSHKDNKMVWLGFYALIGIALFALFSVPDVIIQTALLSIVGLGFILVVYKITLDAFFSRKFNIHNPGTHLARRLKIANSPFITTKMAFAITAEFFKNPSVATQSALVAVAGNKHTPKTVLNYLLTLALPSEVLIALAGNPSVNATMLTVLAVKADITEDVFSAILDNKNVTTTTVRNIIAMLDDPYSLIDGGSPQSKTAEKAINIFKERNPEFKDVENRYIIASCSPLF